MMIVAGAGFPQSGTTQENRMTDSPGKSFLVHVCVRSAKEFEPFAAMAGRLRRLGETAINVSQLSGKTLEDVPEGGSPWHEYTTLLPVLTKKFFPHPKEQAFVNMDYVRKNVALMRACVRVLRKHKLAASFNTHDPFFMPEEFFVRYPHLRGARLDHPRRSRQEAFGICRDTPEGQDMLAWSMAAMVKEVPELTTLSWLTNDAGGGICWCEYLYPGPNGPAACRHLNTGQRVAAILGAFDRGSQAARGKPVDFVVMHANFTGNERRLFPQYLDAERTFWSDGDGRVVRTGSVIENPLRGIFDPVAITAAMERARGPHVRKIAIDVATNYSRCFELPATAEKVFEIVEAYLDESPAAGTLGRLTFLRGLCARWVGPKAADALLEALIGLNEAYKYKLAAIPRFNANYVGVSMRHINRPLVALPDKLTPEEEGYFLPHVFNPSIQEGRMDYLDWHGGRLAAGAADELTPDPRVNEVSVACGRFRDVAEQLDSLDAKCPAAEVFRGMAISLRMYTCILRSIGNFYAMQIVRDRNAARFAAPGPFVPPKVFSMTGDADLLLIHEYMRDELDNTADLLDLMANGGEQRLVLARRPGDVEDTFMLGADLAAQLHQKMAIMRRHWKDASEHLATPHK
jgi:hypothetical protein